MDGKSLNQHGRTGMEMKKTKEVLKGKLRGTILSKREVPSSPYKGFLIPSWGLILTTSLTQITSQSPPPNPITLGVRAQPVNFGDTFVHSSEYEGKGPPNVRSADDAQ